MTLIWCRKVFQKLDFHYSLINLFKNLSCLVLLRFINKFDLLIAKSRFLLNLCCLFMCGDVPQFEVCYHDGFPVETWFVMHHIHLDQREGKKFN